MWELAACIDGFNRANGAEAPIEPPSNDEFDEMLLRFNARPAATANKPTVN